MKNLWISLFVLVSIVACRVEESGMSSIRVNSIVNPDNDAPLIEFRSTPGSINGNQDYTLEYAVVDAPGGKGVREAKLYYSPTGDEVDFKEVATLDPNQTQINFCVPNKNHAKPTFKIKAIDKRGNIGSATLGDVGASYSITKTAPVLPVISSSEGNVTGSSNTTINIDACKKTACSAGAAYYETPTNDLYIALAGAQPGAGDAAWVSCNDVLLNGIATPPFGADGDTTFNIWVKSEDTEFDSTPFTDISTGSQDITVTYDSTPPDTTGLSIIGTSITGKSQGKYKLSACGDISHVLINKVAGVAPGAGDAEWQTCSDSAFSLLYTNFVSGSNSIYFWFKDQVGNVNNTSIPYTTTWDPPEFTVVGGPTINSPNAALTIEFCDEAGITHVLFNETGSTPTGGAAGWQTCSTATGNFNYSGLSPGSNILKAFFKYDDNLISPNPVDVPVFYSPQITWVESPVTNRPQSTFTLFSCDGINKVFINTGAAPAAGDAGWQDCSLAAGALSYDGLVPGDQTLNVWFKDALENVYANFITTSVTYTPPTTAVKDAPTVTTPEAYLTVSDCNNITQIYTTVDDATVPNGSEGGWGACTTANFGVQSPTLGAEGAHTLRTWFKFSDGYILPLSADHNINYDSPDVTPPPITTGDGADADITVALANGDLSGPPEVVDNADSRADFTLSSCDPVAVGSEDDIVSVKVTSTSTPAPAFDDIGWQACSTAIGAIQSDSLADGTQEVYFWFQDAAGNVTTTALASETFIVNTAADVTPPPRPLVTVENAPTLTSAPAELTVADCTDVDQVFINLDGDAIPSASDSSWVNCSTATGSIKYDITIAGDYTLQAWFKDAAGNINPVPRDVSFIFAPVPATLPEPIASWSFDQNHFFRGIFVDAKGGHHLRATNFNNLSISAAKVKEGLDFTAPNTYALAPLHANLKPTVSVTLGMWAYLTQGDATNANIAGNVSGGAGYGFAIQSSELRFYVNGNSAKVLTSSYTTGWHYITGISDGSSIKLFIDGQLKDQFDFGSPQNLTYGCAKFFAVGAGVSSCTDNVDGTDLFTGKIDEINLWNVALSDEEAYDLFVDNSNNFKVNQDGVKPADITAASFFGAFEQTALVTIPDCGEAKFIYMDHTTHPPTADDPQWQPCNSVAGGHALSGLSQGPNELKIWAKDEYDNISNGYLLLDTVVTSLATIEAPILHWNFDLTHDEGTTVKDIYSLHHGVNNGGDSGVSAIQNEGILLKKSEGDFVEIKHASASMLETQVSMSVWARLTQNDNRDQVLAGNRQSSYGYSLEIDGTAGELRFILETSAGTRTVGLSTSSFSTEFHNVVGTYDGQVAKLYIDGNVKNSVDFGSVANIQYDCLPSFVIGAGATCNNGAQAGSHFDNKVDEVLVFNAALSDSKVYDLFNGQDTVPPEPVPVDPKNNEYIIEVPIAKFNASTCNDIASVYVALDANWPDAEAAGWQPCSTSGNQIKSTPLSDGANTVKIWFKDAAGNVSLTSTDLLMTMNYSYEIPDPNSFWTFDMANVEGSTIYDVLSAKNGTETNTTMISGVSDEALSFNGSSSKVLVNNDASHQPATKVTLSAWINVAAWPTSDQVIAGNLNDGGYALVLGNNTIEWRVKGNGAIQTISVATGAYPAGNNYLITGVYDNGNMRLFIDDTEVATQNIGTFGIDYTYTNAFVIGDAAGTANDNLGTSYFSGVIDEVAFWEEALTDTVVEAMYDRGINDDKIWYDIIPPEVPVSTDIIYYNSLVSRANVTITDCTGVDYIIITASKFPPDKNDEDWQLCNTYIGGTLSKELDPADSYGKIWTKDLFGNVSKSFKYAPITTQYDKPIARPVAHWTFDADHVDVANRKFIDRISKAEAVAGRLETITNPPFPDVYNIRNDSTNYQFNQAGVLNEAVDNTSDSFAFCEACDVVKPKNELSVSAWVYIPAGFGPASPNAYYEQFIASTYSGGKGWGLGITWEAPLDRRVRFVVTTENGDTLSPYLETADLESAWHLITGVYDGQTASLYVDGIFVKSFSAPTPSPISYTPGAKFGLGNGSGTGNIPEDWYAVAAGSMIFSSYTGGAIDEVLVWDSALTGIMVSSLYHNGADILYVADTTPPAKPAVTQENQLSQMYDDKVYATMDTCADVSGVLINEGTQPDKQDERWEICRTRRGAFKYALPEDGGHTVTYWYKDLAGNVTPASSDLVVNYDVLSLPIANAYWPLDEQQYVAKHTRDVIQKTDHELFVHDFDNGSNVNAVFQAGKQGESMQLEKSYLITQPGLLLKPVNELTLNGWFYFTNGDLEWRVLFDNMYNRSNEDNSSLGFEVWQEDDQTLNFALGLELSKYNKITTNISAITTGWHMVTAVFDNDVMKLYVDAVEVASKTLFEEDFITYDSQSPFVVGAYGDRTAKQGFFWNEKLDEIGLWGQALTPAQITDVLNKGNAGQYLFDLRVTPTPVNNAYFYHYDNFGKRARFTMLNCDATPWVYVGPDSMGSPDPVSPDWQKCQTRPGTVFSDNMPLATNYARVWTKNLYGDVSASYATVEIDPVDSDVDVALPLLYWSMNSEHRETQQIIETFTGKIGRIPNLSDASFAPFIADDGMTVGTNDRVWLEEKPFYHNEGAGITVSFWADLVNGDTSVKTFYEHAQTKVWHENGELVFQIHRNFDQNYNGEITNNYAYARVAMSDISTGKHYISATYDGKILKLYVDAVLHTTVNAAMENYQPDARKPLYNGNQYIILGKDQSASIDELMIFDRAISQTEIYAHYERLAKVLNVGDTTPPGTGANLSVAQAVDNAGTWETNDQQVFLTIDDCADISGIMVKVGDGTTPLPSEDGWQSCNTLPGSIEVSDLSSGSQTVYVWYKDANGNIVQDTSLTIDYTENPSLPVPVAYWTFDKNMIFADVAYENISQNHAEIYAFTPTAGSVREGIMGNSGRDFAKVRPSNDFKPTEELTISFWLDGSLPSDGRTIFSTMNGDDNGWRLFEESGVGSSQTWDSSHLTHTYYQFQISLGGVKFLSSIPKVYVGLNKHQMTLVYDGRRVHWYVDGVKVYTDDSLSEQSITYASVDPTPLLFLANLAADNQVEASSHHATLIDEFAIWDKALTPLEVAEVHSRGSGGTKIHDSGLSAANPTNTVASVYDLGSTFYFGDRIRASVSDCTGMDMVLITDTVGAPASDSDDWQVCNTFDGGIISASLPSGSVTPRIWAKSYEGVVSAASGTLNGASVNIDVDAFTLPRPKVFWALDQTATGHTTASEFYDSMYNHPGSLKGEIPSGSEPTSAAAILNNGFDFNGSSQFLVYEPTANNTFEEDISISVWAHLVAGDTGKKTLLSNKHHFDGTDAGGLSLSVENNHLKLVMSYNANNSFTLTNKLISVEFSNLLYATGYHHIVGTFDGTVMRLYLDGVLVADNFYSFYGGGTPRNYAYSDFYTPWFIGVEAGAAKAPDGNFFQGKIDDIMMFDSVLSDDQVSYLFLYGAQYKAGNTGNGTPPNEPTGGVALKDNQTIFNTPFVSFEVPACVGANGETINAIYIATQKTSAPADPLPSAPDAFDPGWIFCTEENEYIFTELAAEGSSRFHIFYRDEEGEVTAFGDRTTIDVTYNTPEKVSPSMYYSFNDYYSVYEQPVPEDTGVFNARAEKNEVATGVEGRAYKIVMNGGGYKADPVNWTFAGNLELKKNFSVSLWFKSEQEIGGDLIHVPGMFRLAKSQGDQIQSWISAGATSYGVSKGKVKPKGWSHVSLVREGSVATIYIDGKKDNSFNLSNSDLNHQTGNFLIGGSDGYYDEVAFYDLALSSEQVAYNYFLGKKATPEQLYHPAKNLSIAPIPDHYYSFDTADTPIPGTLNDKGTGALDLAHNNSVDTGDTNSKVAESYYFTRASGAAGESLEAAGSVNLGSEFTISSWVRFDKTTSTNIERPTLFAQWGATPAEQAYRAYVLRDDGPNNNKDMLYFEFRKEDGASVQVRSTLDPIVMSDNANWWHVVARYANQKLIMYINGRQTAFTYTWNKKSNLVSSANFKVGDIDNPADESHRFQGNLDELAIWKNQALSMEMIVDLYNRGLAGKAIASMPEVILAVDGATVDDLQPGLSISDCGGFTHVMILRDTDSPPGVGDAGWQACSEIDGDILSLLLNPNQTNSLVAYFKTGGVLSTYHYDFQVTHNQSDTTPPANPGATLDTGTNVTNPIAKFTISSCADVERVIVVPTGAAPSTNAPDWTNCTVATSAISYSKLYEGVNNISVWYKDVAGNVSATSTDFSITYTEPLIATPDLYLTGDKFYAGGAGAFDMVNNDFFSADNSANAKLDSDSIVGDSYSFSAETFLERDTGSTAVSTDMTFTAWLKIAKPAYRSMILNKWDDTAANDGYGIDVDSDGRLCYSYQTSASVGASDWKTLTYDRKCTNSKMNFGKWNHIVARRSGANLDLFINAKKESASIDANSVVASALPLRVGAQARGGSDHFTLGNFDELAVWTSSLSDDQVAAVYGRGMRAVAVAGILQGQAYPMPLSYWSFDNADYSDGTKTLSDLRGSEDLSNIQSVSLDYAVYGVSGQVNQAFDFFSEHKLESATTNFGFVNDMTLSTWFNVYDDAGIEKVILQKGTDGDEDFKLSSMDKILTFEFMLNSGPQSIVLPKEFENEKWYNFAMTRSGADLRIYLNGSLEYYSNTLDVADLRNTVSSFKVGSGDIAGNEMDGTVDDTGIWTKAMDVSQVQALFEKGEAKTLPNLGINVSVASSSNAVSTATAPLTVGDCAGFSHVLIQATGGGVPASGSPNWQVCNEAIGTINSSNLTPGVNVLDVWFKAGAVVEGAATTTVTVQQI